MASIKAILDDDGKQKRDINGLLVFRAWVCNGARADGKPKIKSKTIYAKSERDAERQANALEVDFKRNVPDIVASDKTLFQLIERYKEEMFIGQKEKTLSRYQLLIDYQIIPYFGNAKLKDIRPETMQSFVRYLGKDSVRADGKSGGYSAKTIKDAVVLLRAMLEVAVDWEWINRNPCRKVKIPKTSTKEARYYDKEDIARLLYAFDLEEEELESRFIRNRKFKEMEHGHKQECMMLMKLRLTMYKLYTLLAINTGARRSEMTGLEFSDFDAQRCRVRFNKTSQHISGQGVKEYSNLKNGDKVKYVSISAYIISLLAEYQKDLREARAVFNWQNSDKVFISLKGGALNPAGGPINPDTVSQWWDRFLTKYHLPKITLHQVRHTNISVSIDAGVPLTVVAQRAGHRHEDITVHRYGHAIAESERRAGTVFDDVFCNHIKSVG